MQFFFALGIGTGLALAALRCLSLKKTMPSSDGIVTKLIHLNE